MEPKFVAPTLMLGFGLLAGLFGMREFSRLRANPAPLTVPCDASAIEGTIRDRWVVVEGCEPLLADIFEVEKGSSVDELLVPLRAPGAAADEPPVALLAVRDPGLITAYNDLPDASEVDEWDAEVEQAVQKFMTKLDVERVEGVTGSYYGKLGDSRFVLLRQRYNLPKAGVISINRGDIPRQPMALFVLAVSLILLPLGIVYLRRALKQPSAPQPPVPPGLPR